MRGIYQELYKNTDYGSAAANRCPGVRYFPYYRGFLKTNVIDVGCGNGDTVRYLRKQGFFADGLDWINNNDDMMVRDIREYIDLRGYKTALCIDVLEHIEPENVQSVLDNLRFCERQVVTVHTGPAKSYPPRDLHLTQWSLRRWDNLLCQNFHIVKTKVLEPTVRKLYLMEKK